MTGYSFSIVSIIESIFSILFNNISFFNLISLIKFLELFFDKIFNDVDTAFIVFFLLISHSFNNSRLSFNFHSFFFFFVNKNKYLIFYRYNKHLLLFFIDNSNN